MALLPLLALIIGFALFWVPTNNLQANEAIARYTAIAILAGFDTILGGLRASMDGKFDNAVFISGFFVNVFLAAGLLWLGEYFGLQTGVGENKISVMMIAAVVIFSTRILNNLAVLRRQLIDRWRERGNAAAPLDAEYSMREMTAENYNANSGTGAANLVK